VAGEVCEAGGEGWAAAHRRSEREASKLQRAGPGSGEQSTRK
jgi:hypothetical protein